MSVTSVRRRTTRAAAVLASGLLALGLAQAPSTAAAEQRVPSRAQASPLDELGLTWAEVRDLAASLRGDTTSGRPTVTRAPRRTAVVTDPRGDARRTSQSRGPRPHTLLADLTRVFYRTPSRVDGDLRVRATWADHVDASGRGVRRQYALSFLFSPSSDDFWVMWVGNARDRLLLFRVTATGDRRVRPADVSIERDFGRRGTTTVTLSSEWLDTRRVGIGTVGLSGFGEEAFDTTRLAPVLAVGPVRR